MAFAGGSVPFDEAQRNVQEQLAVAATLDNASSLGAVEAAGRGPTLELGQAQQERGQAQQEGWQAQQEGGQAQQERGQAQQEGGQSHSRDEPACETLITAEKP